MPRRGISRAWALTGAPGAAALVKGREEARKCHVADCEHDPYLARAWPDFDALFGEDFQAWAEALLRPLRDQVGTPPKGDAE